MNIRYGAQTALETAARNRHRAWGAGKPTTSAKERFNAEGYLYLAHKPKFKIDPSAKIFTMGSCFARNVEGILASRDYPLLLKDDGLPAELYERFDEVAGVGGGVAAGKKSRSAFNKYNAHSMTHEIRRVLMSEVHEHGGLIELEPGKWFDPHASGLMLTDFETATASRRVIEQSVAKIRDADVVFLTLGLTETWLDNETGLAMNRNPGTAGLRKFKDRFTFVDYSFGEIFAEMSSAIELIRATCKPDVKFIITVSPVPLGATFRDQDIIVANSASKAKLRTVCDELQRKYEFVDYFPSYEYVVNSPVDITWKSDRLHVEWGMVDAIMTNFIGLYYAEPEKQTETLKERFLGAVGMILGALSIGATFVGEILGGEAVGLLAQVIGA